jgi:hypothetical protein
MPYDQLLVAERAAIRRWHECTDALLAAYLAHHTDALPSETSVIDLFEWSLERQRAIEAELQKPREPDLRASSTARRSDR